jgi:hypothetical protein
VNRIGESALGSALEDPERHRGHGHRGVARSRDGRVTSARQSLPSVVAIWLIGVVLLSSRLLVSFLRVRDDGHARSARSER